MPHEKDIQFMFFLAQLAGEKHVGEDGGFRATGYLYKGVAYIVSIDPIT
jgi:hypothetical protein